MDFLKYRKQCKEITNPIVQDYLIANDLLLYALYNSPFRYNFTLSYDHFLLSAKKYLTNPIFLKLKMFKYDLNKTTIYELIKLINVSVDYQIKISREISNIDENRYIVPLSFIDKNGYEISHVNFYFESVGFEQNTSICVRKWIELNILKEKVYFYNDCKERVFCDAIKDFLYDYAFYPSSSHLLRIKNHMESVLNVRLLQICLNKDAKQEKFTSRSSYINSIINIIDSEQYKDFDLTNLKKFLTQLIN